MMHDDWPPWPDSKLIVVTVGKRASRMSVWRSTGIRTLGDRGLSLCFGQTWTTLPACFSRNGTETASEGVPVVDESLLTITDVARFLSVTDKTAYRLAQSGRIPAFKVGWIWRFREAEIRSWLEKHRQPDAAGAKAKKQAKRSRRRRAK
jgi:excisionase family DNA binding protein